MKMLMVHEAKVEEMKHMQAGRAVLMHSVAVHTSSVELSDACRGSLSHAAPMSLRRVVYV